MFQYDFKLDSFTFKIIIAIYVTLTNDQSSQRIIADIDNGQYAIIRVDTDQYTIGRVDIDQYTIQAEKGLNGSSSFRKFINLEQLAAK